MMSRSPASSGLLPMPGSPSSSWALYRARIASIFRNTDTSILVAFWLFGLINNVLYVIILSAALDLVGSDVPKGVVLLADVLPSFLTKLIAPYFIHKVPYWLRIIFFVASSSLGMFMIALTPSDKSVGVKMAGVIFASLSSGAGELSFLGLTHYYGHMSLAAWGSGTGAAGLVGAGLYVMFTVWIGFSVRDTLLASAFLPVIMFISFFLILPREPLRQSKRVKGYQTVPDQDTRQDDVEDDLPAVNATSSLLTPERSPISTRLPVDRMDSLSRLKSNIQRAKSLFFPYMLPLLLVYVAEYTINQGVSPTLLFPIESTPFKEYRDFYPMYGFLYQLGVFISRSSIAFIRIKHLYIPSFLQIGNLVLLTLHALLPFLPNAYVVFVVIFWEGLLGGAVYVNTFAEIMQNVPTSEREFSLGATSVSDSAGICIAGFVSMAIEVWLCDWQVQHGRDWCKKIQVG
ncbi:Batten's disease protein Cln3 [Daldinia caldariorum]|uniref:Batten's disease protein Cln3 n=1 Tax=Daldinia caldariorum TaxID=326644 RepID=UPI002007FE68|nr:Batten's disease protein Cln3 [Daldinia caldariorum]KAI1471800.1 Batten's disease protein Cln3 [Daldinia caldariorum]